MNEDAKKKRTFPLPEKETDRVPDPAELKVSTTTDAKSLAGAIYAKFQEHGYVKMRCIGNGAIGNAFRAATIAQGNLAQVDVDVIMRGAFFSVLIKRRDDQGNYIKDEQGDFVWDEKDGTIINIEPR